MADEQKKIRYDVDGFDIVTTAIRELISRYPALPDGDEIAFSTLGEDNGIAMFPITGAVIEMETKNICGHVKQVCLYPFIIVYRAKGLSENRKAAVKEWLDNLGRWLEQQSITVGGESYRLAEYPALTGTRKILQILRQTPAYLDSTTADTTEDWQIYISARYQNEFDR